MHRLLKTLFLLPWLSACAPPLLAGGVSPHGGAAPRAGVVHDFNWRLSGDRRIAPLQVFDDGRQTWLQFAPGQAMPALFVEHDGIERPVGYTRRGPYAIVQGKWPSLVMRGGALQARADYLGATAHASVMNPTMAPAMHTSPAPAVAQAPRETGHGAGSIGPAAHGPARGQGAAQAQAGAAAGRLYRVGPADENMRRALARWAGLAGWTFQTEHWAVDVDIPLSASADFSDDFKGSVRELVAATELGERPLQPCFYANQVLRIVPLSQACDRTAVRPGTSI